MLDFDTLYRDYATAIYRFALGLSGDRAVAEDITAETFVRVWTARERVRHDTVRAFLFAIARNLFLTGARASWRQRPLVESDAATGPLPDAEAIHRIDLARALERLRALDPEDRAALLMRADGEMSYEEIGQALGVSAGAARVRVHRARRRLQAAIAGGDR
ncbi:MAG: RNA polymerase sigma factor [Vicinamibacterales bacterium]